MTLPVIASLPQPAAADPQPDVSLAGTFNGWNTADPQYKLSPAGARQELVCEWPRGVHRFKFVFGGSWDRHWGISNQGALEQPGGDILLNIRRPGRYAVWLDVAHRKWGLERRPTERLRAVLQVHGAEYGAATVTLDGRMSAARDGRPIQTYRWNVEAVDVDAGHSGEPSAAPRIEPDGAGLARLTVSGAGRYRVGLEASDGEQSDRSEVVIALGQGCTAYFGGDNGDVRNMQPMGGGLWGAVVPASAATSGRAQIRRATDRPDQSAVAEVDWKQTGSDVRTLLLFDERARVATIETDGWFEFVYSPPSATDDDDRPEMVGVAGDFNDCRAEQTPLFRDADGNAFRRLVLLADGLHEYRLVVNGSEWIRDPRADSRLPSSSGNSAVRVGDDPARFGAARPNAIESAALKHDPRRAPFVRPVDDRLVDLTVRALAGDVRSARLRTSGRVVAMELSESRDGFDFWSARVGHARPDVEYAFELCDGNARTFLGAAGAGSDDAVQQAPERDMAIRTKAAVDFPTPDWAKTAVWYQIFPERFRNGSRDNDPPSAVPWTHSWFTLYQPDAGKPDGSAAFASGYREQGTFYANVFNRRYGGDIQGIQQALPYLRRLGVTALYLNPVFIAESLHKYDARDYRHIDDTFGVAGSYERLRGETTEPKTWQWSDSDRVFLDFLKQAHEQGFKVVIDGVFNHTGREFWAFQDVLRNGSKSPYAGWFDITSWDPLHYKGWDRDDGALPRLKHDDALGLAAPVREHLFAVTRRWMDPDGDGNPSDGIDGWRLDVAQDINEHFWRDWRKLVKSINPQAYITAEIWTEAKSALQGDQFDAVMNYEFAKSVQRFFVNRKKAIKPSQFDRELHRALGWYGPQVNLVLQNLFGSHDTDRIASMMMNPDVEYDASNRLQDNGPEYDPSKPTDDCYQRVKLAVTFQMTYLGAPMVYYGDEVGMFGEDDPGCRKPMWWEDLMPYDNPNDRIRPDLLEHHRRLIAIRNTWRELQVGAFHTLTVADAQGVYAFARTLDGGAVAVVLNNSGKPRTVDIAAPQAWSAAGRAWRADDPATYEVIDPPASTPSQRPTVRAVAGRKGGFEVSDGMVRGVSLQPRSGAVLVLDAAAAAVGG